MYLGPLSSYLFIIQFRDIDVFSQITKATKCVGRIKSLIAMINLNCISTCSNELAYKGKMWSVQEPVEMIFNHNLHINRVFTIFGSNVDEFI